MKKSFSAFLILLFLFLGACQVVAPVATQTAATAAVAQPAAATSTTEPTLEATLAPTAAPLVEKVEIKYAKNFSLEYKEGYKLLSVKMPESSTAVHYALVPKGTNPIVNEKNALVISTPIEKIITLSSTYYPMLEQIGKLETVVGIDDGTYTYNETIRGNVASGKIAVVGGDGFSAKLNLEKVIELAPDLLMAPYMNAQVLEEAKLKEAKQTLVLNADYLETSPLGRAEWGKFVAAFYNMEGEADILFDQVVARYEEVKKLAAGVGEEPSVFVNTAYQGSWYMPGKESYMAALLKDAGANYLFADSVEGTGASPVAFEVVYEKAKDADYWLNIGFAADIKGLVAEDARYGEFKAVIEGKVYNNNARMNPNGGTDYYEGGVAHPDVVLRDLINIFHPGLLPEPQLFYYSKVN
jgi:iron complex transport system substrate-binding protein